MAEKYIQSSNFQLTPTQNNKHKPSSLYPSCVKHDRNQQMECLRVSCYYVCHVTLPTLFEIDTDL